MGNNNFKKYQYKGAIHIHSLNSDGSGDIETITRAAQKAGLSWIILTDHNYFDTEEGLYNDVYVHCLINYDTDNKKSLYGPIGIPKINTMLS